MLVKRYGGNTRRTPVVKSGDIDGFRDCVSFWSDTYGQLTYLFIYLLTRDVTVFLQETLFTI